MTFVLFGLHGCGYKTMPVPPEEVVPKPVTDLRYELDQKGVTLIWSYPQETMRGDQLTDIISFKVFRAVVSVDEYCETCPVPFGEPVIMDGGAVVQDKVKTAEYTATLLRPRHLYFFKIRSAAGWWAESADSNIVSFMWDVPPGVPQNVEAIAGDSSIILTWEPVTNHVDGSPIEEKVGYQLFRSTDSGTFAPIGQVASDTEFVDTRVQAEQKYQYKVQAVTIYEKGRVGGSLSGTAEAVAVDTSPPPVPTGVQGIRTARGVKVVWSRVKSSDLGGYRVYRRLPDQEKPVKVADIGVAVTIFDDTDMPEADSWYYSVTTFDKAQPPNESDPSPEVNVRN